MSSCISAPRNNRARQQEHRDQSAECQENVVTRDPRGGQTNSKRQPRIKVLVVMHSNSPPHETGTSLLGIPEPAGSCREYEERRVTLSITGNCLVICLSAPGVTRDDIFLTFRRLVTMLLLSRSGARRSEMAIRAVLGAGRGRLLRMLATEGLVLAAVAGTVSI